MGVSKRSSPKSNNFIMTFQSIHEFDTLAFKMVPSKIKTLND